MRPSVCDIHAVPGPCIKKGEAGGPRREQPCEGNRATVHIARYKQVSLVSQSILNDWKQNGGTDLLLHQSPKLEDIQISTMPKEKQVRCIPRSGGGDILKKPCELKRKNRHFIASPNDEGPEKGISGVKIWQLLGTYLKFQGKASDSSNVWG